MAGQTSAANVGSVGVQLRVDTNFDLSLNTSVTISLLNPQTLVDEGGAGTISVTEITDVIHDDIESQGQKSTFSGNEYVLFTTTIPFVQGRYKVQAVYVDGGKTLFSDKRTFLVEC